MSEFTHFRYTCRTCKKQIDQPILKEDPAATPIPTCCSGNRRNSAFVGPITKEKP